ncbi:MAG: hypothetical protein H3C48_04795 [Chitinophagaceae bacterium]|nr:hypothetical protein [Chitinophagaceae bacterium]
MAVVFNHARGDKESVFRSSIVDIQFFHESGMLMNGNPKPAVSRPRVRCSE